MTALHPMRSSVFSFFLLVLSSVTLAADPTSLFSVNGFQKSDFGTDFALLSDAVLDDGDSCVNLTSNSASSSGNLVFKKPFRLIDGRSGKPVSFSTEFVFSVSPGGDGDGLAFVIAPAGGFSDVFGQGSFGISKDADNLFVAVEFDTGKNPNAGDSKGVHVTTDVSSIRSLLNGGEKLQSWVDYEANSKRLEIRLSKFGSERPYDPSISHSIDLFGIWGEREVLVAIGSSSQDSAQMSSVCSWSFQVRTVPSSLHSMPVDPRVQDDDDQNPKLPRKKNCALRILGGVIFATGCGTLVAFCILFLWVVFSGRHSGVTPEVSMKPLDFKYEKVNIDVNKISYEA